ncbi:MAG: histidinol-phosphatase [Oscillospiraceae bacterium]|nr:histidinol-phosphatase [Oscillospiraceae bacterium]
MIRTDLHMHTCFCDGKNTPEEMVLAAIDRGMECIGFSGHSHTPFDESWCMSESGTEEYRKEIRALKEKYRNRIVILCGIEQDFYSPQDTGGFDYVIGSVHYLKAGGEFIPVDESAEILKKAAVDYFDGDLCALAEEYYRTVSCVLEKTGADIIGHFDLITKFLETDAIPDIADPRYISAWKQAADRLIAAGRPFELNTGAISRGYRTSPYPGNPILEYILENGGKILLSSDSHSKDTIGFEFDRFEEFATEKTWIGEKT